MNRDSILHHDENLRHVTTLKDLINKLRDLLHHLCPRYPTTTTLVCECRSTDYITQLAPPSQSVVAVVK